MILVKTKSKLFGPKEDNQLADYLQSQADRTTLQPITDINELLLTKSFKTRESLRYTDWAIYQMCRYLCGGFHRVLSDLLSTQNKVEANTAAGWLNQMIRLRFEAKLLNKQLFRDPVNGTIEGIVGSGYRQLLNVDLFNRASMALGALDQNISISEAVVSGHHMAVRFYSKTPAVQLGSGGAYQTDAYFPGYYISNHDVGVTSLVVARSLIRRDRLSLMTQPILVRHQGRDFDNHLSSALNSVFSSTAVLSADDIKIAGELKLGMPSAYLDQEKRIAKLAKRLQRLGLSRDVSKHILIAALKRGAWELREVDILSLAESQIFGRNVYDVVTAICRMAKTRDIRKREQLEYLAYDILTRKAHII